MPRLIGLSLEHLERRDQPSVFGNPWLNGDRLTISFAPDGVSYSDQTNAAVSNLFSKLNAAMPTGVWQEEILRGFYAWTAQANLNIGLVADSGQAFGSAGMSTAGAGRGDIRVGGFNQSAEVLAINSPFHPLTGNRAGDLLMNGSQTFTKGGAAGSYDLYTAILDEAANILGLADTYTDTTSARFYSYIGTRAGLNADDVAAIQAMYGARPNDTFEGANGNGTVATASSLSPMLDPANATKWLVQANGSIATTSDVDVYQFTTGSDTTSLGVRLNTAGRSLLAGKVEVFDAAGNVIASRVNTSPLDGDAVLTVDGVQANATYYLRVSAGRTDDFAVGTYQLRVGFNYTPSAEAKESTVQMLGSDGGTNESLGTATTLVPTTGYTTNTHYSASADISSLSDVDFYKLTVPSTGGVMTVSVQGLAGLHASATVYSTSGAVVAANVLLSWEDGLYRAQVPSLEAGETYFLKVWANDPDSSVSSGDYFLDVDFKQPLAVRDNFASGDAGQTSKIAYGIELFQSTQLSFSLNMASTNQSACNWFDIYIYDVSGNVVASLGTDGSNGVDTLTVFLAKGKYTIKFVPIYNFSSSDVVQYTLSTAVISDPIEVYDPTVPPPQPTSPPPPPYTSTPIPITSPIPPGYYDPWSPPVG